MPLPPATGNSMLDAQRVASHSLAVTFAAACFKNEALILPMNQKYQELTAQVEALERLKASADEVLNIKTFTKMAPAVAVTWLEPRTDIPPEVMVEIAKNQDDLSYMIEYETQFRPGLPVSDKLKVKKTCFYFMNSAGDDMCKPMSTFYARGGVAQLKDGGYRLNWKCGAYTLQWGERTLETITFRNGDSVHVKEDHIGKEWDLDKNFSDMRAALVKRGRSDQLLHLFFVKSNTGPHAACFARARIGGVKSPTYQEKEVAAHQRWTMEKAAMGATSATRETTVKTVLDKHNQNKRKSVLADARAKGKAAMEKRRNSTVVKSG